MGYAYLAKVAESSEDPIPDDWPSEWNYISVDAFDDNDFDANDVAWPPGWPVDVDDQDLSLSLNIPLTAPVGGTITATLDVLDGGSDTDVLEYHIIVLSAAIGGTTVGVKKNSGDSYTNRIAYLVTNYTGSKYGFSEALFVNTNSGQIGSVLTVTASVFTISDTLGTSDTSTIANAGTLNLSASTYSVLESGGAVTVTVTRTSGSSGAVGVSYATSNGTATAGSDYTATSGTLSWADGDSASKTFNVSITDDSTVNEGNETFTVIISSPTGGATLGATSSATVTITDNDIERIVVFGGDNSSPIADCDSYTSSTDAWSSKTDMLGVRQQFTASTISGKGYTYCGHNGSSTLRTCDEYNISTNAWANKTDAPTPSRQSHAAATISSAGYICGGVSGAPSLADCDEFTAGTNSWSSKTDFSTARSIMPATAIGSSLYICGGSLSGGSVSNKTDQYTPGSDTWTAKTNMISQRATSGGSTIGSNGYVYSGLNGVLAFVRTCEEYNPSGDSWSSKTDTPISMSLHTGATANSLGHIIGGQDSSFSALQSCYAFDANTNSWSTKSSMPSPARFRLASCTLQA